MLTFVSSTLLDLSLQPSAPSLLPVSTVLHPSKWSSPSGFQAPHIPTHNLHQSMRESYWTSFLNWLRNIDIVKPHRCLPASSFVRSSFGRPQQPFRKHLRGRRTVYLRYPVPCAIWFSMQVFRHRRLVNQTLCTDPANTSSARILSQRTRSRHHTRQLAHVSRYGRSSWMRLSSSQTHPIQTFVRTRLPTPTLFFSRHAAISWRMFDVARTLHSSSPHQALKCAFFLVDIHLRDL